MGDSSFARLVGALFSPRQTFEAIRERPTWALALAVLVVIGMVVGALAVQKMDVEEVVRQALERQGRQISEDQLEQAIDLQEKLMPVLVVGGALVGGPLAYLLVALLFWVIFKLLGGDFPYKTSFSTTLHAMMPTAVSGLLTVPVVLSRSELSAEEAQSGSLLASNLGFLATEETGAALRAVLTSLDVFSLWVAILLAVGYSIVGKVSRTTAAVTVAVLWAVWILAKVGLALLSG